MGLRGPKARTQAWKAADAAALHADQPWNRPGLSRATRNILFIESLCTPSGDFAGNPLIMRPFQREILEAWYRVDEKGQRLVRTGLLTMGRKNAKSTLCAAIAALHLFGPEQVLSGQIRAGAADRKQAAIIFQALEVMIQDDETWSRECNIKRFEKTIEHKPSGSTFVAMSSDAERAHGQSPGVLILDELAQWGDTRQGRKLYEALTTAHGAWSQPLAIIIGTQSPDDRSLMSQQVDYAKSVNAGTFDDPTFSGFIFEIPDEMDVFDEATWILANPALGDFRSLEDMRDHARKAKRIPALETSFRNLFCNQRVDASEEWIPAADWRACENKELDIDSLIGKPCFSALDLSAVDDLTAFALFFPDPGALLVWSFLPQEGLRQREEENPNALYVQWAKDGWIETIPGRAIRKRAVAERMVELCATYNPEVIMYDRYGMPEFLQELNDMGVDWNMVEHGQGYKDMSPACKSFHEHVLNQTLIQNGNPVLAWALSNVVPQLDSAGNIKLDKARSRDKIDPVVAAVMAVNAAEIYGGGFVYESEGLITI